MEISGNKLFSLFLAIIITTIVYFSYQFESQFSYLGVFLLVWVAHAFVSELGSGIPIKRLIILMSLIQWFLAPLLSYHFFTDSDFYGMQVPEVTYMELVVPGILLFHIALNVRLSQTSDGVHTLIQMAPSDHNLERRGYFLYFFGAFALLIQGFVPAVISFFVFLLSKLIYIGAFYLLAAKVKYRYLFLGVAFLPLIIGATGSTVFHDLFLWGGFIFMVYALIAQISTSRKISFLITGIMAVLFVQYFKTDYREQLREQVSSSKEISILEVAEGRLENEGISDDYLQELVDRLNQGWIIARIMYVVPDYEPFAEGETIRQAVEAALLPRFLSPNKIKSGGQNFERFTKIDLRGASMNLGLIGEAYANYGVSGAYLFLTIVGLLFNLAIAFIFKRSIDSYEILLWMPFLFLYVVKAEDDFATLLNQFTKSAFVCWLVFWLLNRIYPASDKNQNVPITNEG